VTRYRRPALGVATVLTAALVAGLLAGCSGPLPGGAGGSTGTGHGSESRVIHHGPTPTAMRHEDGVEVWDLTGPPTVEAFGIDTRGRAPLRGATGAYSSTPERQVRLLLPGGRSVDLAAGEVIFEASDSEEAVTDPDSGEVIIPQGRRFFLRVDGVTEEGVDAGVGAFRDALQRADLPTTKADELRDRATEPAATADTMSTKRIGESVEVPGVQGATASVSSSFGPRPDVLVFQLQVSVAWDPVPIP